MTIPIAEIASEGLKHRVFECALADLNNDEVTYRKFRLIAEEVQGRNVLTNFHGLDTTTDKLRSMVKKWQVRHGRNAGFWYCVVLKDFLPLKIVQFVFMVV